VAGVWTRGDIRKRSCHVYPAPQTRAQLLEPARRASTPGWWTAHSDILPGWFEAYLGLEAAASVTWSGRTSRAGWDSATRDVNRPGRPCVP